MNARISRIFLFASLFLLLLSGLLLAIPGNYWPWFAIGGACAVVPAVAGPKWYRIAGIAVVALAIGLIISDQKAGVEHRKRLERLRNRLVLPPATNGQPDSAANRSPSIRSETNSTPSALPPPINALLQQGVVNSSASANCFQQFASSHAQLTATPSRLGFTASVIIAF